MPSPCGCGGGAPAVPMTSADYAAAQEAAAAGGDVARFRLVRSGYEDATFATYAAARQAAGVLGGVVRTVKDGGG